MCERSDDIESGANVWRLKGDLWMRGRPKKDGAKTERMQIRLTKEQYSTLSYLCSRTKLSKSEILGKGLEMYSDFIKSI